MPGLASRELTLAEALRQTGYKTGMVGKWHLGDYSRQPEFNPRRHGFDFYLGVPHSNDMVPCPLYKNETELAPDIGTNQARLTGMYTEAATGFITSNKNNHFFLYLAHTFPHQPVYASTQFAGRSFFIITICLRAFTSALEIFAQDQSLCVARSLGHSLGSGQVNKDQLGKRWPLFYDLATDPQEAYNVIDRYPEIAEKLIGLMDQWQQATEVNPGGWL